MNYFRFINSLAFERIAGSKDELDAANIIAARIKELNGDVEIENFKFPFSKINKVDLIINNEKYEVKGFHLSGNIDQDLEVVLIDSPEAVKFMDLSNKACLIPCPLNYKFYEELAKAGAKAIICTSGSLYDDLSKTDLQENMLRPRHLEYGKIACFAVRMIDAEKIALSLPAKGHFYLEQEEDEYESHNVIAKIKGESEKCIYITAHYDSVRFSKGAYDNATGSATILALYEYFLNRKPKYSLCFLWCGAEERGLLGSKAYTSEHKEELDNAILNINVDMTGVTLGHDIACVTGEIAVVNYVDSFSKEIGFPINVSQGVYSSDSTPFADNGVPSISFARLSYPGGAAIHSNKDNGLYLSEKKFNSTLEFISDFLNKILSSHVFPIDKKIPDNMVEEINKYYGRKNK